MTTTYKRIDLDEVDAVLAAAAPAPWVVWEGNGDVACGPDVRQSEDEFNAGSGYILAQCDIEADGVLIAKARQWLPDMAAELRDVRRRLDGANIVSMSEGLQAAGDALGLHGRAVVNYGWADVVEAIGRQRDKALQDTESVMKTLQSTVSERNALIARLSPAQAVAEAFHAWVNEPGDLALPARDMQMLTAIDGPYQAWLAAQPAQEVSDA